MQLVPSAAQQFAVQEILDPKQNIEAGAKYLRRLIEKY
jgi:membrane-bound lytic murein transglycosylase MltF